LHRWDADAVAVHATNFHDLATRLPELVQLTAERIGLATDLFEQISGRRSLLGPETRRITFVDNILENLWRSVALGAPITADEWSTLHQLSSQWRPTRIDALKEVHDAYDVIDNGFQAYQVLVADYEARASSGVTHLPIELDLLRQQEAAILSLQGSLNEARNTAMGIGARFG
jgi:hypothetical protein